MNFASVSSTVKSNMFQTSTFDKYSFPLQRHFLVDLAYNQCPFCDILWNVALKLPEDRFQNCSPCRSTFPNRFFRIWMIRVATRDASGHSRRRKVIWSRKDISCNCESFRSHISGYSRYIPNLAFWSDNLKIFISCQYKQLLKTIAKYKSLFLSTVASIKSWSSWFTN
jgi:hypothetical protein